MGSRQGKHWHVCQNWILSLHRNFFWGKENQISSLFFLILGEIFSKFQLITWGHLCRNCLVSVQMNHLGKKVVDNFFFFCDDEPKKFGLWAQKTAGLLKLHSTSPQEHFEERSWHVLVFFGLERTFFYKFRPKTSGKSLGTAL